MALRLLAKFMSTAPDSYKQAKNETDTSIQPSIPKHESKNEESDDNEMIRTKTLI